MIELARLPVLLLLLIPVSPSLGDLRNALEQAHFLGLYLGGHQCFPSQTASSLRPSENALATKPAIIYATKSLRVI